MFEFLKKIMNNNEPISTKEINLVHRILNTDIKKEPKSQEDSIFIWMWMFLGSRKMFLETSRSCYNFRRLCWWRQDQPNLL